MLTNEEKKMLRVVAAYNDITEEQAKAAIVKLFLSDLLADQDNTPLVNMKLPQTDAGSVVDLIAGPEITLTDTKAPEKPKNKGGRPRKKTTLASYVNDTVAEVKETERLEKMSRDKFVDYFGGKT